MSTSPLHTISTMLAACSAVAVAAVVVKREFASDNGGQGISAGAAASPNAINDWNAISSRGHRFGSQSAALTIVEFVDYQCPGCKAFERTLRAVRQAHPDDVAVVYRHWPLPYHSLAYAAARAVECAASQGRFEALHSLLFEKQDSLGIIAFQDLARRAGVPDEHSFGSCFARQDSVEEIDLGIRDAASIGARGTPAIIANGWYLPGVPDFDRLDSLVRVAVDEKRGQHRPVQ